MSFWFYWCFTQHHNSFLIRAVKQNKTWQLSLELKILLRQRKTKVGKTQTKHQISKIKLLYMNLRAFFLYAFLFKSPRQHKVTQLFVSVHRICDDHHRGRQNLRHTCQEVQRGRWRHKTGHPVPHGPVVHLAATTRRKTRPSVHYCERKNDNDHVFVWIMSILAGSWCLQACVSFSLFTLSVFNNLSLWCKRLSVYN